jgi:hypothetical protein
MKRCAGGRGLIFLSVSASFWSGVICYLAAIAAFAFATLRRTN